MTNKTNVPRWKRGKSGLNLAALQAELAGAPLRRPCRCEPTTGEMCVVHYKQMSGVERTAYRLAHGGPLSGPRPS